MTPSSPTLPELDSPPAGTAPASRWLEIAVALTAVVLMGAVLLLGTRIDLRVDAEGMNPRSWPTFLGGLGLGLAVILLITALVRPPQSRSDLEGSTRAGWVKLLLTVTATIAFIVAWPLFGFVITAPLFVAGVTAIAGGRGIRCLVIYPVVMTAAIFALFTLLLRVPL